MKAAYVDASAIVKLFKREAETVALGEMLAQRPVLTSSDLLAVEARCTARRLGGGAVLERAEVVLEAIELVPCTPTVQARAGEAFDAPLRALDAIHAATALSLGDAVDLVLAYDVSLLRALAAEGLSVASPGAA